MTSFEKKLFLASLILQFFLLLLFIATSRGAVYLRSGEDASAIKYEITGVSDVPIICESVEKRLLYDISNIPFGKYTVTVRACNYWGDWSAPSVPFDFSREIKSPEKIGIEVIE